ncbi:hypothetical protein PENSTE_c010G05295 [Penicillium steckii]|uniref:Uncharacterized protein n=1 Tax=Penicillium steckii TaxID=303698 RepID=A0A1V6T8G8_9EURO|nr:hypothetical protein PENSTE_c010G05295 [Penicillium steckii]
MPNQRFAPRKTFTLDSVKEVGRKVGDKYTLYNGTGWRPAYLQRRVLILFILLFAGLIAALEVLDHVSNVNYGIASSIESRHYSWTYGPTAILTIVAALWARVEFQAKQNAPWRALQDQANPAEASQSLLLDYVSVMQPVALWNAFKKRHALVAAGISCSLLLRLIIVFSTGLFALQEIPVTKNIDIDLIDVFDASNPQFNSSDAAPYDILNGVLFRNGTYPEGTNKELVYQRFAAPNISSDAILSAPVLALTSRMNCEPAEIRIHEWQWVQGGMTVETRSMLNFSVPSCTLTKVPVEIPNNDVRYKATFQSAKCVESTKGSDDERILVGAFHINQTTVQSGAGVLGYNIVANISIIRSAQMICSPSYSIAMVNTTYNATEPLKAQVQSLPYSGPSSLSGLTDWDVTEQVAAGERDKYVTKPIVFNNPFSTNGTSVEHPIGMGAWLAGRTGDFDTLFEDGALNNVSNSYYQAMAAQFMRKGLVQHRNSSSSGSAIVNEQRVVMTELPLRVIETCLALNILLGITMVALSSRSKAIYAPWDPNTLSGVANLLSQSDSLTQALKGTSAYLPGALRTRLEGRYFSNRTDDGFSIETVEKEIIEKPEEQVEHHEQQPTPESPSKPLPSLGYRIAIFVSVALVIIALEVVLYESQKNNGLGDVPNNEYIHYAWTLVPAIVMVSLSLSLGSIDSNTRLFAPYARLRSVGASFQESLSLDFRDSLDITLIINSIRTKHFAVLATTLAALTASFLTIVTSGLYSPIEVPRQLQINLARKDTFDRYPPTYNLMDDPFPQTIITAQYIVQANLTYPRWTYENLAFPKLEMSGEVKSQIANESFVDLYLPATRGSQVCKAIPFSDFNKTVRAINDKEIMVNKIPKIACPPYSIDQAWLGGDGPEWLSVKNEDEGAFGVTYYYDPGRYNRNFTSSYNESVPWVSGGVAYYWGYYEGTTLQHAAGLICVPGAEIVNTKVRFKLPSFDLDLEHPPEPDESSAKRITNDHYLPPGTFTPQDDEAMLDTFFDALTAGRYAIPKEYLARPDKIDEVVKAINFQDGIIKAQIFNNNTRSSNISLDTSYRGESQLGTRLRLFQDSISTRVLESLLAFILVLSVLGSILVNTDHILPNSPSSIAAMASLLADSNFLDWYRPSPEEDSSIMILGQKLFAGCRFFIGRREQTASSSSSTASESETQDDYTVYLDDSSRNGRLLAGNSSQSRGPGSREETENSE